MSLCISMNALSIAAPVKVRVDPRRVRRTDGVLRFFSR